MKTKLFVVLLFIGVWIVTSTVSAQPPAAFNFVAPLSGDEEVPPVDTNATGLARFQLYDEEEFDFTLIVANIEGITQAHIHCGGVGVNGPVVVFLFRLDPAGVTVNGILSEGTITADDVIPRPDSPECPGGVANFVDLIAKMRSGETYANVHTLDNAGGEIRGQIQVAGPRAR
jgi:hypothetical protein